MLLCCSSTVPLGSLLKISGGAQADAHNIAQQKLSGGPPCRAGTLEKPGALGGVSRQSVAAPMQHAEVIVSFGRAFLRCEVQPPNCCRIVTRNPSFHVHTRQTNHRKCVTLLRTK